MVNEKGNFLIHSLGEGTVSSILFKEGDTLNKGDLIVTLENPPLQDEINANTNLTRKFPKPTSIL